MNFKSYTNINGVFIDDGKVRVVVDTSNEEIRLFSHYINEEGKPKLCTEEVMEFEAFLKMLSAMYFKGESK